MYLVGSLCGRPTESALATTGMLSLKASSRSLVPCNVAKALGGVFATALQNLPLENLAVNDALQALLVGSLLLLEVGQEAEDTGGLYPAVLFGPTRLNSADDPTRNQAPRTPVQASLLHCMPGLENQLAACKNLSGRANWVRLSLLLRSGSNEGPSRMLHAFMTSSLEKSSLSIWFGLSGLLLRT